MANYNSEYTGHQVDTAVGRVMSSADQWDSASETAESAAAAAESAISSANAAYQYIDANFAKVNSFGLIEHKNARVVYLDAMVGIDGKTTTGLPNGSTYYQSGAIRQIGGTTQVSGTPNTHTVYISKNTLKAYRWTGSSMQEIQGSGAGLDANIYEAIKTNVNKVQAKLDALIGALANMAFNSLPKPALVGTLTWPDGTAPTPTPTPSLSILYNDSTVSGSTVNTVAETDGSTTISFVVNAANLTTSGVFELTLSSAGTGIFNLSTSSITAAQATNGATVTVSYSGTSAAYATLSVSGNGLTSSVDIAISAAGSGLYTVIGTLTNCYIDASTSVNTQVPSGGTWSGTIVAESGYELPAIDGSIITSGTVGGVSLSGSTLTISNITSDITFLIVATAAQQVTGYITDGLVLHLDGKNQGSTPGSWIDTIGLKEFVLIGNPTVTADGVSFSTDGERQYGRYTGSVDDWPAASCTIEVCFKPTRDFDEEGAESVGLFCHSTNKCIGATFVPGDNRGFGFASVSFGETGTRDYKRLLPSTTVISSDQAVTLSMNFKRHMLNGVVDTSSRVNTRLGTLYGEAGLSVGGFPRAATTFVGCDAIIHEVRIYNRLLSEDDMKDNQKCDNYRYNLGLNI